ncbi:MAG: hypothetical protein A3J62_03125 [Candidatus Buchananbacteria bacterium RIFCSPHIGHO2_02_FULL_38_8]|uniref:Lactamase n=2 Tax=Candidatus Buchananiibacteriota TaxID=1817903 RepID=A0A1G1XTD0_9BACT|nr:MAG: hypothetical protein A2731_00550 [Candidatus Buchananbacteria bacterium RIFCSPHIGHO2_01_FULL_39_8]OGY47168.1 MAG: hypothetical protein A3J62_03125 [Candidatus Buchananbacteria bacterium RIFCSPHIGHO2_02_FULL_38_8]
MIINWFGQTCFKIQGEKSIVVTDPLDKSCGLKTPRLSADIVTISHYENRENAEAVKGVAEGNPFIVDEPGEYEIKNAFIYGIPLNQEEGKGNIIYRIEVDNISIAHLGNLNHALANGQIEKLEGIDILLIPTGGNYTIDSKQATEIISQLEPRIVIPMHYNVPGLKLKNKIDGVDKFCKEIGVCPTEKINKFKILKKDLPQEEMKVIVMQP